MLFFFLRSDAQSILNSITSFPFIVMFLTVYQFLSHLSGVTVQLQSSSLDIIKAYSMVCCPSFKFGKCTKCIHSFQIDEIKAVYREHRSNTKACSDLVNRNSSLTAGFTNSEPEFLFVSFDFVIVRWCLKMRFPALTDFFADIDQMFGLGSVYAFSQEFPTQCLTILQIRFPPPEFDGSAPKESLHSFEGALHWMEGLRQKGWTAFTIAAICLVTHRKGLNASLPGRADNQVMVVRIPKGYRIRACPKNHQAVGEAE